MKTTGEIVGIVLAAGLSTRMGKLKQLLPIAGKPVVCKVAETMRSRFDRVVVVLGHRAEEVATVLRASRVECVVNDGYRDGMLSSVQCALHHIGPELDFAISLGDQPSLRVETIEAVLAAWQETDKRIVLPTYGGKRGHPVVLGRHYTPQILGLELGFGLNEITRGFPADTLEVALNAAEILQDMDTPEEYEREVKRAQGGIG
jgi:molybdenum cofactor cytidylyltransferase